MSAKLGAFFFGGVEMDAGCRRQIVGKEVQQLVGFGTGGHRQQFAVVVAEGQRANPAGQLLGHFEVTLTHGA